MGGATLSVNYTISSFPSSFPVNSSKSTSSLSSLKNPNSSLQSPSLASNQIPYVVPLSRKLRGAVSATTAASGSVQEVLPPALDSTSDPPTIFDGTTRLYISYTCPYAQRVWITRNCKGLQEKIKLIPIDLKNRPAWYKDKIYPANKVPSLEHNNEVRGESLDLMKFIDSQFEGPSLFPDDSAKRVFAEELLSYTDKFNESIISSFKNEGETEAGFSFDYIEEALSKFDDGPFLLGQFSLVDIAYAPFIERYHPFLLDVKNYDITAGRSKLAAWIEVMDKNEAFRQTRRDRKELVERYKRRFSTCSPKVQ